MQKSHEKTRQRRPDFYSVNNGITLIVIAIFTSLAPFST
jgi:hypothetical protein